jgi:sugar/nucleoside kinase (ribokinase family)
MRGPIASAAVQAAELARGEGARISLDLAAASLIDDGFRDRVRALAPDLLFANETERDAV